VIEREWRAGDRVDLGLPMQPERLYSHPDVRANIGRVCLRRGPLIYCVEEADNAEAAITRLRLPAAARIDQVVRADLFDGIVALAAEANLAEVRDWDGNLYRAAPPAEEPAGMIAIPYYLWSNRGQGRMAVWIPEC
jgi:DUF1680 family protein